MTLDERLGPRSFFIADGRLRANESGPLTVSLPIGIPPILARLLYGMLAAFGLGAAASAGVDLAAAKIALPRGLTRLDRLGIGGRVVVYLLFSIAACFACAYPYADRFPPDRPDPDGGLHERVLAYLANPKAYDTIFLGDSRTFTDFHADLVDPLAGTRSVNLSMFANWFPTQLAVIEDIVDAIPPGTRVVWSVGNVNFFDGRVWPRVYPLKWPVLAQLIRAGKNPIKLAEAVAWSLPIARLFLDRAEIREAALARIVGVGPPKSGIGDDLARQADALKASYAHDPAIVRVEPVIDEGMITSVILTRKGGTHYRIELRPDYFRRKQAALEPHGYYPLDPFQMHLFVTMLGRLRARGIDLVVNELEDAPFYYDAPAGETRERSRKLMRTVIRPLVESYHFTYMRVDFNKLQDDDYFDYNHMNSKGVALFTTMFAEEFKRIRPAGRRAE